MLAFVATVILLCHKTGKLIPLLEARSNAKQHLVAASYKTLTVGLKAYKECHVDYRMSESTEVTKLKT